MSVNMYEFYLRLKFLKTIIKFVFNSTYSLKK